MSLYRVLAALTISASLACASSGPTPLEYRQAETHRSLAALKLNQGEYSFAIREYALALESFPNDAETHFGIAEAYRRKGRFADAERHFKTAARIDPKHQDALFNLGVVYIQQERWAESVELNTELLADATFLRPARALVNRGWAHYKSGNLELAEQDFRQVLAENRADHHAHLNLGVVLVQQGEMLDAMVQFERVLELIELRPPTVVGGLEAQARFHLAQAHVKLGHRTKAIEHLEVASERGGDGEWAEKSRKYLKVLQ